jgi:hypothetical protein
MTEIAYDALDTMVYMNEVSNKYKYSKLVSERYIVYESEIENLYIYDIITKIETRIKWIPANIMFANSFVSYVKEITPTHIIYDSAIYNISELQKRNTIPAANEFIGLPNVFHYAGYMQKEFIVDLEGNLIIYYVKNDKQLLFILKEENNYRSCAIELELDYSVLFTYSIYYIDINGIIRSACENTENNIVSKKKIIISHKIINIIWSAYLKGFVCMYTDRILYYICIIPIDLLSKSEYLSNNDIYDIDKVECYDHIDIMKIDIDVKFPSTSIPQFINFELNKEGRVCIIRLSDVFRIFIDLNTCKGTISKEYSWLLDRTKVKGAKKIYISSRINFNKIKWRNRPTVSPYLLYDQQESIEMSPIIENIMIIDKLVQYLKNYTNCPRDIAKMMIKYT